MNLSDKNLLVISNAYPNIDGSFTQGIFIKDQVNSIKNNFNKLYVISPLPRDLGLLEKGKKCKDYSYDNVFVYYPKAIYLPKQYVKTASLDFRLNKIGKLISDLPTLNLIHAHFGTVGKLVSPLKSQLKVPLVTSFYGYDAYQHIYDENYYKSLFDDLDIAIVLSDHMAQRLMDLGLQKEQVKKVHIGIDLDVFNADKNMQKEPDTIEILIVANFVEKKGILNAIYAFAKLTDNNNNTHLTILGRGPLKEKIHDLIYELKIENSVSVIDNYATANPRKTVQEHMQKCDIFLLPSIRDKTGDCEGTPVVLMEASACEKPCITTNHSGNPEVIIHNETGLVVPENNILELAKALDILVNNHDLRLKFGKKGREHITLEFNKNEQSKKMIEIYEQLLK